MSSTRPPSTPPDIPGYKYVSLLGSGGFSDVFLYEQDRPRRKVAVKVLLSGLKTEGARRAFESEANLMAQLSSHPYIVTIYEANITEDGHNYLAMEYCSRPSLDVRYRRSRLGVDEVLALGVQVASAVESAHRAGIVHRDIKPANILTTDYNRPALTDFGISGTTDALDEEAGMSIPWSAPEAFVGGRQDGVAMDVWSLGATLYTLLAGRSPFVRPGADNSQKQLITRIGKSPLQPLNRADVPASLEQVLATAMAKAPGSRFPSVHALALSLQRVQAELGLSVTPFEVMDESGSLEAEQEDEPGEDATRVRQIVSIDPDGASTGSMTGRTAFPPLSTTTPGVVPVAEDATIMRPAQAGLPDDGASSPDDEPTMMGGRVGTGWAGSRAPSQQRRHLPDQGWDTSGATAQRVEIDPAARSRGTWFAENKVGVIAAAVVLLLGVVAAVWLSGVFGSPATPRASDPVISRPPGPPQPSSGESVTAVRDLTGAVVDGKAVFTWTNPEVRDGDTYMWRTTAATGQGEIQTAERPTASTEVVAGDRTCIEVVVVRSNGKQSEPQIGCIE